MNRTVKTSDWPLFKLSKNRKHFIDAIVSETMNELSSDWNGRSMEDILRSTISSELKRISSEKWIGFTTLRHWSDRRFWSAMRRELDGLEHKQLAQRALHIDTMIRECIRRFALEIASGRFSPPIYFIATKLVPFGLSWLLNVISLKQFAPWRMEKSLETRVEIFGHTEALRELSKKGTIILLPTHLSNLDSLVIAYAIHRIGIPPFAFGAGLNLFANPVISFFMSHLGAYTVDRRKKAPLYGRTLLAFSTRIIKSGVHTVFFPGGTRSRSGAVETKLKIGLLGTAQKAAADGTPVFIVPMTMSSHSVLEASSLIREHLGRSTPDTDQVANDGAKGIFPMLNFFWRFLSRESAITVRIGKPLDIYGNVIDDHTAPCPEPIDPARLRSSESKAELGKRIAERFTIENTVLSSHATAFAFYQCLKRRFGAAGLLAASPSQTEVPIAELQRELRQLHTKLIEKATCGKLQLPKYFYQLDTQRILEHGIKRVGAFHRRRTIVVRGACAYTQDPKLLLYYANRCAGYGLESPETANNDQGLTSKQPGAIIL
jgi:glycerol-3-phosphate O-acyltransferase